MSKHAVLGYNKLMPKLTVKDIFDLKGKRQLTEVYVSTPTEAAACEAAGIDMIITGERGEIKSFRAAAPNTFFLWDLSTVVTTSMRMNVFATHLRLLIRVPTQCMQV